MELPQQIFGKQRTIERLQELRERFDARAIAAIVRVHSTNPRNGSHHTKSCEISFILSLGFDYCLSRFVWCIARGIKYGWKKVTCVLMESKARSLKLVAKNAEFIVFAT